MAAARRSVAVLPYARLSGLRSSWFAQQRQFALGQCKPAEQESGKEEIAGDGVLEERQRRDITSEQAFGSLGVQGSGRPDAEVGEQIEQH